MFSIATIKPGDRVWVMGWSGVEVVGTVTIVHADVKNGRPGIDYRLDAGVDPDYPERWAYMSQVTDVRAA